MLYSISSRWKTWKAILDFRICLNCLSYHNMIREWLDEFPDTPPAHPNCRCKIVPLKAIVAGTATKRYQMGADYYLKKYQTLPSYYITKQAAKAAGWVPHLFNLAQVCPGKMIAGGIYKNKNKKLPVKPGRVWYEADFDYTSGIRNSNRILWSNDGLIFVTYNHYITFLEIV